MARRQNDYNDTNFLIRELLKLEQCSIEEPDIHVDKDIDLILISCRTIAPFKCRVGARIIVMPNKIWRCKNVKLTTYYLKRHIFPRIKKPSGIYNDDTILRNEEFFETVVAFVDNNPIHAVFQVDNDSAFFRERVNKNKLFLCASQICIKLLVQASTKMTQNCKTVKAGIQNVKHAVDKTYTVFQEDFVTYATCVSRQIYSTNLRGECGLAFLRFYVCLHGLRLQHQIAEQFMHKIININNRHIDIIQIHRANTILSSQGDIILLKTKGKNEEIDLKNIIRQCTKLGNKKMNIYTLGYLFNYGHFDVRASPTCNRNVTYIQAYSSGAKMARPKCSGTLATFALLHNVRNQSNIMKTMRKTCFQYVLDLTHYCKNQIMTNYALRIEEVVTIDHFRRRNSSIEDFINDLQVFSENGTTTTALRMLADANMFRKINKQSWKNYCKIQLLNDLECLYFLYEEGISNETGSETTWRSAEEIRRVIQSEFRISYFVHGNSHVYNFTVYKNLFLHQKEAALNDGGIIQIKSYNNITDKCDYPLYTDILYSMYSKPIRHLWLAICAIPPDSDSNNEFEYKCVKFIMYLYITWTKNITDNKHTGANTFPTIEKFRQTYNSIETAFKKQSFIKYLSEQPTTLVKLIHTQSKIMTCTELTDIIMSPTTHFSRIFIMSITIENKRSFVKTLKLFINNYMQVFPTGKQTNRQTETSWSVVSSKTSKRNNISLRLIRLEIRDMIRISKNRGKLAAEAARKRFQRRQAAATTKPNKQYTCPTHTINVNFPTPLTDQPGPSGIQTRPQTVPSSDEDINIKISKKRLTISTSSEDEEIIVQDLPNKKKNVPKIVTNIQIIPPQTRVTSMFSNKMDEILVDSLLQKATLTNKRTYADIKADFPTVFKNVSSTQMITRIRQIIKNTTLNICFKKLRKLQHLVKYQGMP
ncbi:hypothetical protein PUN28_009838 [Cardiocondyla obscurior]|uniref:Uncharacterized protein n=1 Tax=Cardiocondyla obscurior TaxID=286306 RepID=A0AAW2FRF6_9HYME